MTSITSSTGKSWLNIVTGKRSDETKLVQPDKKGSLLAKCRGELLVMLGHYGWIKSLQPIDHSDSDKHGGRIYIKKTDIRTRSEPKAGDEVVFCLYADHDGLGAEDCYVVGESQPCELQQDELQWVNTRVEEDRDDDCCMNPHAQEFIPGSALAEFEFATPVHHGCHAIACAFNMAYFSDDSDSDTEDEFEAGIKAKSGSQDDNSTWAGDSSDSDSEMSRFTTIQPPPGLALLPMLPPGLESPPGLEFLQSIEPPPGLALSPAELLQNQLLMVV